MSSQNADFSERSERGKLLRDSFGSSVGPMSGVRVLALTADGVEEHAIADVASLLLRDDVLIWVDIPECSDDAVALLTDVLELHPLAVRDCLQRNRVPRVRIYQREQLLILHGPERGPSGHVHYI